MTTVVLPGPTEVVATQSFPHQHQQQTVTYQTVHAQPQPAGTVISNYSVSWARQTGYMQVACGVLAVAIGITALVLECKVAAVASPIWSGILFFIVAGILGITSAGNQNSGLIVAHLVMSILASLAAFQMMCLLIVAALSENSGCYPSYNIYRLYRQCDNRYGQIAVDSIGSFIALVEFIVAIIASAICCRGSCGSGTVASQQTIVHHYIPNQGNMTVMTNPQPYGQQGYAQQPQAYTVAQPQAYSNQAFAMPPQPSQSAPMAAPPPYNYDNKVAGLPLPQA